MKDMVDYMVKFKKVKKESLTDTIIDRILDMISSGELKKGEMLPSQKVLADSFGVSQSPIREALCALEAMGAVKIKVGEGTFVSEDSDIIFQQFKRKNSIRKYRINELVEARQVLETAIIGLAIKNMNDSYKKQLLDNCIKLEKAFNDGQIDKFIRIDFDFHLLIANISGNSVLKDMLAATREAYLSANKILAKSEKTNLSTIEAHKSITEAMCNGQTALAKELMYNHISLLEPSVLDALDEE